MVGMLGRNVNDGLAARFASWWPVLNGLTEGRTDGRLHRRINEGNGGVDSVERACLLVAMQCQRVDDDGGGSRAGVEAHGGRLPDETDWRPARRIVNGGVASVVTWTGSWEGAMPETVDCLPALP